ncbi:MAG: hypothetical protein A3E01_08870 [Gammaproteobacteria bacterium RIFCSPHIGHO2_12_FULL_63_22]|nr:MAG: hypothetical protein A3E01_08870 [Gammaproteobacteria bacterium RIFCSPHIGHO2_12_FULL_63_22]
MTPTSRFAKFALLLLTLLVMLAYWPGLGGGFIFDDRPNIYANTALHVSSLKWAEWVAATLSSPAANFPRPLAMFTFAVNHYFTGLDAWPMKLTNVAIHLLNTYLVFRLALSLIRCATPGFSESSAKRSEQAALFVAAAWALNPINLMAVLYVVQRMESLCHVFVFAGLLAYLRGRELTMRGQGGWWLVAGSLPVFGVLGALSKESALLLPVYGLCLELCIFRFRGAHSKSRLWFFLLYLTILVVPAILALSRLLPPVLGPDPFPGRDFNLVERLLTEPRVVLDYLRWTIYPSIQEMSIYQDDYVISRSLFDPLSTAIAIVLLLGLGLFAIWVRTRRPLMALGVLWFLSAQLMTATIIPLELVFEHRNYFASFGVCLALADLLLLLADNATWRKAGTGIAVLFVLILGLATTLRAWEWRDPLSFAISEAGKHPDSPRAVYSLGVALANIPDLQPDSPIVAAAFERFDHARQLPKSNILPDQAALVLAARLNLPLEDEWWVHMQTRLRDRPLGPQELAALGGLTTCASERRCDFPVDQMMATFQAALSHGPNPEVESVLGGYFLNVLRQPDMALFLWHGATERNPREPQYRISVIKLLIALRRYDEARDELLQLRQSGKMGQYESVAEQLAVRLSRAEETFPVPRSNPR